MNELSILQKAFDSGTAPDGADAKMFQKCMKKYAHIVNPKFVNLYPIRDCRYDDMSYRVFAMPINGESIDNETLEAIKEELNALPVGSIRYNAAASGSRDIEIADTTANYKATEEDTDDVMSISNHFHGIVIFTMSVFNSKVSELDCNYAIVGKWDGTGFGKWTDYTIIPIENKLLGKDVDKTHFAAVPDTAVTGDPQAPASTVEKASQKYMQIMQYVFYLLVAIGLIWYFFLR